MAKHEAVRIIALVGKARQLALPVRRHQAKRVPAFRAPGVASALLLKHDVINPGAFEVPAHGKARLSAADDSHRMVCDGVKQRGIHWSSPSFSKPSTVTRLSGKL